MTDIDAYLETAPPEELRRLQKLIRGRLSKVQSSNWVTRGVQLWSAATGGSIAPGRFGHTLRPFIERLEVDHGLSTQDAWCKIVEPLLVRYLKAHEQTQFRYASPEGFVKAPGQEGVPESVKQALDLPAERSVSAEELESIRKAKRDYLQRHRKSQ